MDDYETGLQRGRGGSRHSLGRMRWLLIASLCGNVFLFYKAWDYSSQINELEAANELMRKSVVEKNVKEAKSEDFITALHKEKEKCNKYLIDTKDLLSECERGRKECSESLDATSSKLMDNADTLHKLEDEKGQVNALLEKCNEDLVQARELTEQLRTDVIELHKKEAPSEKAEDQQTNMNMGVEPIQEIKAPENQSARENSEVDEVEGEKTKLGNEAPGLSENKAPELLKFASCLFNEDLTQQKCIYRNDPESPTWKLGHAEFLNEVNSDQDEKDVLCIYVDDSVLSADTSAGIIFDEFKTDSCVEVILTFLVADTGMIIVEDSNQSIEFRAADASGWRTEKFVFKQAPSHLIKLTGKIQSKGGAAIASIAVAEAECSSGVENGGVVVDEAVDSEELDQILR